MKKILKFIPIILFIIYLIGLEIWFWTVLDKCGLGFGIITHGSVFPVCTFLISLIYSLLTKSKYKYLLALFFGVSLMIFEATTFEPLSGDISLSVIPLGLIYSVVSLIGILLGNLRKDKKQS